MTLITNLISCHFAYKAQREPKAIASGRKLWHNMGLMQHDRP